MSETISEALPSLTLEQLCDWNGGIAGGSAWNIPKKHICKHFPQVFEHWGDAPPSGLMFEVAANSNGNTRYFWVRFV